MLFELNANACVETQLDWLSWHDVEEGDKSNVTLGLADSRSQAQLTISNQLMAQLLFSVFNGQLSYTAAPFKLKLAWY